MGKIILFWALLSTLTVASSLAPAGSSPVQGFTTEGIAALNSAMHNWVDKNSANMVTILARNGQVINHDAYGADKGKKVTKDSIYNLMSMTKPISGVAMMTFFEEGKFALDDLVSKHIPDFADLKVKGQPQKTPMTMRHLLSHSAGFPSSPVFMGATLKADVEGLRGKPLAFQPGENWMYGIGVEVQGYLMEKWAGKDFSDILQERILKPLGMIDTGFWTPEEKRSRIISSPFQPAPKTKPRRILPSYGLHSTAEDYLKFCQMVLNGGELNGTRYLKPETVQLMRTNVLALKDKGVHVEFMGGGPGIGFGLDFAVVVDREKQKAAKKDSNMPEGSFFWGGAFGTWFWIDPTNNVTFVGLINKMGGGLGGDVTLRATSAKAIYEALRAD